MTTEEKAKAYDEAKAHMSAAYNSNRCTIGFMNEIFPELTESEDERIKKALSDILLIDSDEIREILDSNNLLMQDIDSWLKNQGKQKSIYDLTQQEAMDIAVAKCFEQGEQKPVEWHREDEQNLNACLGYIPDEFLRRWLQDAIHTRYDKPAEWSEENETVLNNLIYALANDRIGNDRDEYVSWLKSLKDRYTWKPSEGQMEFLKKCIEAYNEVTFPTEVRVLSSLYNVLKKLREE